MESLGSTEFILEKREQCSNLDTIFTPLILIPFNFLLPFALCNINCIFAHSVLNNALLLMDAVSTVE